MTNLRRMYARVFKEQLRRAVTNRAIGAWACGSMILLLTGLFAVAQETAPNSATSNALMAAASDSSPVPRLVRFAGVTENKHSS